MPQSPTCKSKRVPRPTLWRRGRCRQPSRSCSPASRQGGSHEPRRLWKLSIRLGAGSASSPVAACGKGYGNGGARGKRGKAQSSFLSLSTAAWKSRKKREIPTFPQPAIAPDRKGENQNQVSHFPTRGSQRRLLLQYIRDRNTSKKFGRSAAFHLLAMSRKNQIRKEPQQTGDSTLVLQALSSMRICLSDSGFGGGFISSLRSIQATRQHHGTAVRCVRLNRRCQ